MSADNKRGRRYQNKSWDLRLRHVFSVGYLEDADLHALMFISGDHFTSIMQRALREFASNHGLPTNDNDFQSKLYLAASKLISENREKPDQIDVLQSMGESSLIDKLGELAQVLSPSSDKAVAQPKPAAVATKSPLQPVQPKPAPIAAAKPQPIQGVPAQTTPSNVQPKPRLPLPEMDFGPELDENEMAAGQEVEVKKTPLKDRWLSRHSNVSGE